MIRVEFDGLLKRIDRLAIVDGASMEIRAGELAVIVGPSGAGKTTLARLIAGLDAPDRGEIDFDGKSVLGVPAQKRRVGLVFQDDALWPHLTVAENVGYGLRGLARKESRRRVADALGLARIDSLAEKLPGALGALQRQRVALARSLVVEPDLLILDEPLGPLGARDRDEFRDEIRRLQGETETTMLVLTSDPREALGLAGRLGVMDLGKIVQVGLPEAVYNRPVDAFVARLLGPANLIQGHAEATDPRGEIVVRTPLGRLIGVSPSGAIEAGTPVTVVIRPESISVGPSVPAGSNRFPATLERQTFLGEVRTIDLRGPNDWPVRVLALQGPSAGLREGQSLTASVPPELVIVLASKFAASN